MHYLDASACVALLTPESGTRRLEAWSALNVGPIATSPWVHTEVCSALSTKVRTGALLSEDRSQIMSAWTVLQQGLLSFPVTEAQFVVAAEMVERHELSLRASDALHLAICAANSCSLVTLDERMAKAALALGVAVTQI